MYTSLHEWVNLFVGKTQMNGTSRSKGYTIQMQTTRMLHLLCLSSSPFPCSTTDLEDNPEKNCALPRGPGHGSVGRTLSCSRARLASSLLTLNRLLAIFSLGCPHPRRRANDVHSSGKSWPSVSFRATNGGGRQTLEHMKQSSKQVRITGSGRERTP